VKRQALIHELIHAGCFMKRHGSRHDIYANPKTGKKAPVPRHSEIDNRLARKICDQLGIAPIR